MTSKRLDVRNLQRIDLDEILYQFVLKLRPLDGERFIDTLSNLSQETLKPFHLIVVPTDKALEELEKDFLANNYLQAFENWKIVLREHLLSKTKENNVYVSPSGKRYMYDEKSIDEIQILNEVSIKISGREIKAVTIEGLLVPAGLTEEQERSLFK